MRLFSIILALVITSIAAAPGGGAAPPGNGENAEIDRLRKAVSELSSTADRYRKELRTARRELAALRAKSDALSERLNSGGQRASCAEEFESYIGHLVEWFRTNGISLREETGLLEILRNTLITWSKNDPSRAEMIKPSTVAIDRRLADARAEIEALKSDETRLEFSPQMLLVSLYDKDDAEAAKVIGSVLGREVTWEATVTRVRDNPFFDHRLEAAAGKVKLEIALGEKIEKSLVGVGIGTDIVVTGTITKIENFSFFGATVALNATTIRRK